jgi:hypothetical protein
VLAAYAALAVAFTWPLADHLATHITGAPGGDAGVYLWNQWLFREQLREGEFWSRTSRVVAFGEPADLSLHNYTLFADALSLPLQQRLGLIAGFNLVYLLLVTANAYALFLLAAAVTGTTAEAFLAGVLFGFSPFLSARGTAHYSLVAAWPLPVFLYCLLRLRAGGHRAWALVAGLTMGVAAYCDPYYLVYCALLLAVALAHTLVEVSLRTPPAAAGTAERALLAVAATAGVLWAGIAVTGGGRVAGVALKSLYTPALVFALALLGAWLARRRPRLLLRRAALHAALLPLLVLVAAALLPLLPLLAALLRRAVAGDFDPPSVLWRSSPAGVDLLAFVMPNPGHALFGERFAGWLNRLRPDGYVENAAALSLTGLFVVLLAARRGAPPPRGWLQLTLFFAACALGPFVSVGGYNTALPTPWTLLRYVPGVGLARAPTRFAVVALLGFALLFAAALRELVARARPARRAPLLLGVAALLLFELCPAPVALFDARPPAPFLEIAGDPCNVAVLDIPFGLRDGTRSAGEWSARAQVNQTLHGKPLVGGYLSRLPDRAFLDYARFPMTSALLELSEDRPLSPEAAARARASAPNFLRRTRVGFVVIDRSRASRRLRRFAIDSLALEQIADEWPYEVLVPEATLCGAGRGSCSHTAARCPLRKPAQGQSSSPGSPASSLDRSTGRPAPPSDR